ncbi:MAG: T9SS type A sorting domain-containing protein [candidate division KSB1 bacterium]|nr:T9SS type A sorting domain-containing protein [candidate division KSB1 bacterium]
MVGVQQRLAPFLGVALLLLAPGSLWSQIREYRIHDRGMLHETVYNTGEIGRGWMTGEAGNKTSVPLMEWPSRSRTVVEGIEYSGQHNILGAGMYMAANLKGRPGKSNRIYSFCGGVGASTPEVVFGRWSFPLEMQEIENFPLLPNGDLNPNYDPDEAEEIIIAKWATNLGVTVTRVSRAWSYPDYDDFIIYEYTLEYTGDTDGNPETIERDSTLVDFMVLFIYGFAPSMYGYQRHYGTWKYEGGIYRGDQNGWWDADYWLAFNLDMRTALDPNLAGKPEPNKELFRRFARTGENGGGLCSPQAPGFCILFYDTTHLAIVDPYHPERNESEAVAILSTYQGQYYELDEHFHIKQPWSNKVSTGNTNSQKMKDQSINPDNRWSGTYKPESTTWPNPPSERWIGRAAYNYRQSNDAGQKHIVFGPYTLHHGDRLEFSLAEVVGYGGQPGKLAEGGQTQTQWATIPSWNRKIVLGGEVMTEHYLDDFGYPDYVNSKVITVQDVAHKAFEAYLGREPEVPVWPEDNPKDGVYTIPVPPPAPVIHVENTMSGAVRITWKRSVEQFRHPRLTGPVAKFEVYRSSAPMGPWKLLGEVRVGQVNPENLYEFNDDDPEYKIGEKRYYSVLSVDDKGNRSGRTNITAHVKNIGATDKLGKVHVVPNPFYVRSGFQGSGNVEKRIGFYALPKRCTIRIYSYSGQLVQTIEHDDPVYSTEWFQVTRSGQDIASGIYFYVVTTPDGEQTSGKFVVIK